MISLRLWLIFPQVPNILPSALSRPVFFLYRERPSVIIIIIIIIIYAVCL
jgi:hypothetical protein